MAWGIVTKKLPMLRKAAPAYGWGRHLNAPISRDFPFSVLKPLSHLGEPTDARGWCTVSEQGARLLFALRSRLAALNGSRVLVVMERKHSKRLSREQGSRRLAGRPLGDLDIPCSRRTPGSISKPPIYHSLWGTPAPLAAGRLVTCPDPRHHWR